ncbi:hypothetical protein C9374_012203 [Naegleria lovaniensis]|uniref:EF-hand domain-containing protein n=1 Tax=Naegleria lovaniensis TaxID=51637 RepID=A0AA88G887_NAELO|nr:uncharacterized protein C9374_012203 [Naegleria lovaniensis]KAG2373337.1 hypothetical protein C9374_012203 [Naegleria lovaniensis]
MFALPLSTVQQCRHAFSLLDAENKGYVTTKDLEIVLQALRVRIDPSDLEDLINEVKALDRFVLDSLYEGYSSIITNNNNSDFNDDESVGESHDDENFQNNEIVLSESSKQQEADQEITTATSTTTPTSMSSLPGAQDAKSPLLSKRKLKKANQYVEYRYAFDLPEFIAFVAYAVQREFPDVEERLRTIELQNKELDAINDDEEGTKQNQQQLFKDLNELFVIFEDKTKPGYMTMESLRNSMEKVGEYLPTHVFEEMFYEIDFAKTGTISKEQFLSIFSE